MGVLQLGDRWAIYYTVQGGGRFVRGPFVTKQGAEEHLILIKNQEGSGGQARIDLWYEPTSLPPKIFLTEELEWDSYDYLYISPEEAEAICQPWDEEYERLPTFDSNLLRKYQEEEVEKGRHLARLTTPGSRSMTLYMEED